MYERLHDKIKRYRMSLAEEIRNGRRTLDAREVHYKLMKMLEDEPRLPKKTYNTKKRREANGNSGDGG